MQQTLRTMRAKRADGEKGFTLIELLVVVVIIGVLVAIAIPVYLNYRKGAENKSAASDIRGAISAIEEFYTENNNTYPATATSLVGAPLLFGGQTATVSAQNVISILNVPAVVGVGGNPNYYVICGLNADGGTVYGYSSLAGGAVHKSAAATTVAACILAKGA